MIGDSTKSHERNSDFFASESYRDFKRELQFLQIRGNPPFTQLFLKCCGYGYYQQYLELMKDNFIQYLHEAVTACDNLTTLKVIFNGFDVSDGSLDKIIKQISSIIGRRKLKVLCFHTTNLRKCSYQDLQNIFRLVERCGAEMNHQQISLQLSDWQFQGGYPNYETLAAIFVNFLTSMKNPKFKKFKLQISSWYMKEKQAYNFLKDSLKTEELKKYFDPEKIKGPNSKEDSKYEQNEKEELMNNVDFFLNNFDQRTSNPTYKLKKGDQGYNQLQKQQYKIKMRTMDQYQAIISKKLIKYPIEYIQQLRVEAFHKKMAEFLQGLLNQLQNAQEYHIDLRNWNGKFGMGNLKKILDTTVNKKKAEYSGLRQSLDRTSKIAGRAMPQSQEVGLKTIYRM